MNPEERESPEQAPLADQDPAGDVAPPAEQEQAAPAAGQAEQEPPAPEAAPVEQQPSASEAPNVEQQQPAETAPAERARERPPSGAGRPERPRGGGPPERRRRGGGGGFRRRKVCAFCVEKARTIDYKEPAKLRRYLSDRGRIEARRRTGTCAKHQRWLSTALKRARHLALLPYTQEHIRVTGMFTPRR